MARAYAPGWRDTYHSSLKITFTDTSQHARDALEIENAIASLLREKFPNIYWDMSSHRQFPRGEMGAVHQPAATIFESPPPLNREG